MPAAESRDPLFEESFVPTRDEAAAALDPLLPAPQRSSEYTHKKKIGRHVAFDPEIVSL
jgi:hypothetical protein